ncbi:c-type cytochrome [Celeribacter indicus]|uniref:Cytochrome c domain-containing protein n=1 Tax=Celeribacter indicus TaxID=1208324 RepID=A0A0B5DWA4_9RHOB|nr:cytochrome c [Celeribacter indicus]AJE47324.1 hypothetical protein P73_2609 [Celeribacter indicus]SDW03467.1 hypothetical protein SAMN05443573_101164 [Celeribacter indicus]
MKSFLIRSGGASRICRECQNLHRRTGETGEKPRSATGARSDPAIRAGRHAIRPLLICLCLAAAPLRAEGDAERGAALYAAHCACCHGAVLRLTLSPEDAPRVATFLEGHKTRSRQDREDLAAYLVEMAR